MKKAIATVILVVVGFGAGLYNGFVFLKMWGWFVVPLGMPAIGFWHAVGLGTMMAMVRLNPFSKSELVADKMLDERAEEDKKDVFVQHLLRTTGQLAGGFAAASFFLGMGALYHSWM